MKRDQYRMKLLAILAIHISVVFYLALAYSHDWPSVNAPLSNLVNTFTSIAIVTSFMLVIYDSYSLNNNATVPVFILSVVLHFQASISVRPAFQLLAQILSIVLLLVLSKSVIDRYAMPDYRRAWPKNIALYAIIMTICVIVDLILLWQHRIGLFSFLRLILGIFIIITLIGSAKNMPSFERRQKYKVYALMPSVLAIIAGQLLPSSGSLLWYGALIALCFALISIAMKPGHYKMLNYLPLKNQDLKYFIPMLMAVMWLFSGVFDLNEVIIHIVINCLIIFMEMLMFFNHRDVQSTQLAICYEKPPYYELLQQIKHEETIKHRFSNYLHDEVLQDVLAAKNLIKANDSSAIGQAAEVLNELAATIRREMEDFSTPTLSHLSLKDNYSYLIKSVSRKYPDKQMDIYFHCKDDLTLPDTYHIIIYRFLKELVNNAHKHSYGSYLKVELHSVNHALVLTVENGGINEKSRAGSTEPTGGLKIIKEQTQMLGGNFVLSCEDNLLNISISLLV